MSNFFMNADNLNINVMIFGMMLVAGCWVLGREQRSQEQRSEVIGHLSFVTGKVQSAPDRPPASPTFILAGMTKSDRDGRFRVQGSSLEFYVYAYLHSVFHSFGGSISVTFKSELDA